MSDPLFRARQEHRTLVQRIREAYPGMELQELADTIEGESTLDEAIKATLRAANENDATIEALKTYMERLSSRAEALKIRSARLRYAALQAAQEGQIKKVEAPDFTASVVTGKPKVVITGDVPKTFCREKTTVEPDKTAIGDALHAGVKLPFAELSNAEPYWVTRTK